MNKEYKVNCIFREEGIILNDLICNIFTSFLDEEFSSFEYSNIISTGIDL